jgi:hypothetical protein
MIAGTFDQSTDLDCSTKDLGGSSTRGGGVVGEGDFSSEIPLGFSESTGTNKGRLVPELGTSFFSLSWPCPKVWQINTQPMIGASFTGQIMVPGSFRE